MAEQEEEVVDEQTAQTNEEEPQQTEEPEAEQPEEEPKEVVDEAKADDEQKEDEVEAPKQEEEVAPKEEQKEEAPKKKTGKKKKKKKAASNGNNASGDYWKKLSKKGSSINWYCLKLSGNVGSTSDLEFVQEGEGGASEIVQFLGDKEKNIMFILMKCITTDDAKSVRAKFIYLRCVLCVCADVDAMSHNIFFDRVLGSKVGMMKKAKLTPSLGKIDDQFPCKHLTMDISEKCAEDLDPVKLTKELLRIGGAHKPDKMSFGPDQEVILKELNLK